jgi:alkylation response protein AidB-like acyl-CoA dehydrogenase
MVRLWANPVGSLADQGGGAMDAVVETDGFRTEIRDWLETNCPHSMRTPMPEDETPWGGRQASWKNPDSRLWLERMAGRGFTAPHWPREYGGAGLAPEQARVLQQELARIGARPALYSFGVWMLGPALMEYATEAQKLEHLPKIARGEIRWCQGYSEPGAGSDLASLQTSCKDRGDHFLINGQKIWTSYADQADWIFCLVRTDTARKHEGISFILFDMATPGVETRPIQLISGQSPFCETFFTDVKVPKANLVGRVNGGWDIAKRLLQYERQNISADGFGGASGPELEEVALAHVGAVNGRIADPDLRARIAAHQMNARAFSLTIRRLAQQGKGASPAASIVKYAAATLNQSRLELMVEAMGTDGLGWDGDGFAPADLRQTRAWLRSKGNSIEGGTSEINLNVVAKRVLGLLDHQ